MNMKKISTVFYGLLLVALVLAPFFGAYPVFVMKLPVSYTHLTLPTKA